MKWTQSDEELQNFLSRANNLHPSIKFTHEISNTTNFFLDTSSSLSEGELSTDLYSKNAHPHTYPPNTLVTLANGIQRYLRENIRPEINFMQKNSPVFPLFQNGIDAKLKELTQAGIVKFFICIIY